MKGVANILTGSRIGVALILLFTKPFSIWFYVLYIFCGVTDMVDGAVARKTHTESKRGEALDSAADLIFILVCFVKILPVINIQLWLWIWIAAIGLIKGSNLVSGWAYHRRTLFLHTIANKVTGLLLFLLPLSFSFVDIHYGAVLVCGVATFAAVQEGHLLRSGGKTGIETKII